MKHPVLVLNSDFVPHRIVDWKSAFILVHSKDNGAYVIATYNNSFVKDSAGRMYNIPAVMVVGKYVGNNNKRAAFSKRSVHLRDGFTCQYCGGKFSHENLNLDHVVPRSRPDKLPSGIKMNSFENCVSACLQCNGKKADRTLDEAKMRLIRIPRPITRGQKVYYDIVSKKNLPDEWKPYIESMVNV